MYHLEESKDYKNNVFVSQQNVCIKGSAKITALVGLAEVMGSILKPGHESVEIFSASTSSLLTLSECSKDSSSSKSNLKRTLQNALQRQPSEVMKKALVRARKAATVLLLKSLQTVEMKFVCSFQSFQDIFNLDLGKVQYQYCIINVCDIWPVDSNISIFNDNNSTFVSVHVNFCKVDIYESYNVHVYM